MPAKELPVAGGEDFTFCALIVLALLVGKEKLSSPAYPPKAALRKSCGSLCMQMLHKKKRPRGWKNCVSVPNSHREKFQGVGPARLEVCA